MVDVEKYFRIYGEKLAALEYGRGSFEAAFVKAVWIAYTDGLTEGRNSVPPGGLYVGLQPDINPDPSEDLNEDKRKPSMSPAHAEPYGSSIEQLADELSDVDFKAAYVVLDNLTWPRRLFDGFSQIAERNASALARGVSALRTSSQRLEFGALAPMDPANPSWTDLEFTTEPPRQWSQRLAYVIAGVALGLILASAYLSRYYGA